MAELVIFGGIVVVGLVAMVALVVGRGFKGMIGPHGGSVEVRRR
jgi:hypothetical protein